MSINSNAPTIQAIEKGSVHRICSGQVILDLATAVKEIVENSVDANSTNIEIKLKEYGKDCIEISDNGDGIHESDFESLALKHFTSKLKDFTDLTGVDTFGFRGEALSSLTALSDVIITTQYKNASVGSKLKFDHNGTLIDNLPVPRSPGTSVFVTNLFHTLPVRYKEFHRNIKREFTKMLNVMYAYCMINSSVRFTFINQVANKKKVLLSTKGCGDVLGIIDSIFGCNQSKSLLNIKPAILCESVLEEYNLSTESFNNFIDLFTLSGYISEVKHGCGRSSPDRQFFFINNRPCDFPKLARIVNEVYHMFNKNQYPFVYLLISIKKDCVDVNVTPNKRQIMVHQEKILLALLKASLKELFESSATYFEDNTCLTAKIAATPAIRSDFEVFSTPPSVINSALSPFSRNNSSSCDVLTNTSFTSMEKFYNKCSQKFSDVKPSEQKRLDSFFQKVNNEKRKQADCDGSLGMFINEIENKRLKINNDRMSDFTDVLKTSSPTNYNKIENLETKIFDCQGSVEKNSTSINKDVINKCNYGNKVNPIDDLKAEKTFLDNFSVEKETDNRHIDRLSGEESNLDSKASEDLPIAKNNECIIISKKTDVRSQRKKIIAQFDINDLKSSLDKDSSLKQLDVENLLTSFCAKISPTENNTAEEELSKHITKEMFCEMNIVGQFNLGFIVTKHEENLFLIDQHATDEKYNFETLQQKQSLKGQRLIEPLLLELTNINKTILLDNLEIFRKNGFKFKIDESDDGLINISLLTVPTCRNWTFDSSDVEELIFMLNDSPGVMCRPSRVRKMFASRACRTSVMVGTALNALQMRRLVNHMGEIEHPWNCPHGRPTMRHLICLQRIEYK